MLDMQIPYSLICRRLVASLLVCLVSFGAHAASQDLQIGVRIFHPASLNVVDHLSFSTLAAHEATTFTLTPAGELLFSAHHALSAGMPRPARIRTQGAANTSYRINYPSTTLLTSAEGHTLLLHSITFEGGALRTFNAEGRDEVLVGAALDLATDQQPGFYSGSLVLTLSYE